MNKYKVFSAMAKQARKKKKMCEWKAAYLTKEEADKTGNAVYKCPYCDKFHTTGSLRHLQAICSKKTPSK